MMMKNLLIIAPSVPRYSKSSGGLRLFSLIELLIKTHKITFMSSYHDPDDQSYVTDLRNMGVTVESLDDFKVVMRSRQFEAALLEFYFVAEHYLPRLRLMQPECLIITDTVDVHFLRLQMKADLLVNSGAVTDYEVTRKRELFIYEKSDLVLTVTPDDRQSLVDAGITTPIGIIPNIHVLNPGQVSVDRNTLVFVGGFPHLPNVDAMIYFVHEVLPLIKAKVQDVKLYIVGNKPPQEILVLQTEDILVTGYVPSTTPYLHNCYISVAPLRYGAGMKGKIGEAMAHGIPVVTTSVGAQGMGLIAKHNIMIADTPEAFADAVVKLVDDIGLYMTIRVNALKHISENYTKEAIRAEVDSIFSAIYPIKKYSFFDKLCFFTGYFIAKLRNISRNRE